MFDMGFLELMMIGVVALLVFGPEKLPSVARSAGLWVGRAKRFIGSVKADIDNELRLHELQEQMKQTEVTEALNALNETRKELNQPVIQPSSQTKTDSKNTSPAATDDKPDSTSAAVRPVPAVQSKPATVESDSPSTSVPAAVSTAPAVQAKPVTTESESPSAVSSEPPQP